MKKSRLKYVGAAVVLTAALTFGANSQAATVWDESANGDLDGTQTIALVAGVNTVLGFHVETGGSHNNYDAWNFTLASGQSISEIKITYDDPQGAFNQYPNQGVYSVTGPGSLLIFEAINGDLFRTDTYSPELNDVGNYLVELTGDFVYPQTNWSVDFTVSQVPLPAAAWLFGSGLLGMIGIARRKKAA
jgi:hypothetical protein